MNNLVAFIFNPYGVAYLVIVAGSQVLYRQWRQKQRDRIATQRRTRGLPPTTRLPTTHLHRAEHLEHRQRDAVIEAGLLLITVLVVPVLFIAVARIVEGDTISTTAEQHHLALMVTAVLLITAVSGRQAIQAFVSGLAFKVMSAFTIPFELGDRIRLHSSQHSTQRDPLQGKVIQLNSFFIRLETLSGQRINVPTHTLWHTAITIINGPSQAAPCEIVFYISTHVTNAQQQVAENTLRDTVRSSAYVEPSNPIEVHCKQTLYALQLTAVATVATTDNTDDFISDVTRQFLAFARQKQIPLKEGVYQSA